jgi:hypothetical protein
MLVYVHNALVKEVLFAYVGHAAYKNVEKVSKHS